MADKLVVDKKVKGGVLYTNGMIRIDRGIFSYPHVDKAQESKDGGKPSFSTQLLLDKEEHSGIIQVCRDVCKKLMEDRKIKVAKDKVFIKDGDTFFEDKPECAGKYVVTAREVKGPVLRRKNGTKMDRAKDMDEIQELFYGGAIGSVLINPWVQNNDYGKRINANLRTVRFVEDGTPFGEGRIDDDSAWDDDDYENDDESGTSDSGWDDDGDI